MCLAIPGKILDISEQIGLRAGRVEFGGIVHAVSLDYLPEARVGDYVIVHAGFAIGVVDRQEAERTYELLEEIGVEQIELAPMAGSPLSLP
jgi:hydrogenase expression/formation protein HypC